MSEIRIITAPSVYLVGCQQVDDIEMARFLTDQGVSGYRSDATTDGEELIEVAGRLCYESFKSPRPGGNAKYIEHILEVGHGSVVEHEVFNFIVTGVSRTLTHELVRHRAGMSYCLAGDAEIYSGSRVNGSFDGVRKKWTIRQLWEWSQDSRRKGRLKLIRVRTFDGHQFVPARIKGVTRSGFKPVFKVTLNDGKSIRCSADHIFMTGWNDIQQYAAWCPVRLLKVGMSIATNGQPAYKSRDWLEQSYVVDGMSQEFIAGLCGVTHYCIRSWVRKFGLQKTLGSWCIGVEPWNKGKRYEAGWSHSPETREKLSAQKRGADNPQWKGDEASDQVGRLRAIRLYPDADQCVRCGSIDRIHRHHVDRNTRNNASGNIEFLCPTCHQHEHNLGLLMTAKYSEIISIEPDGEEMTYDIEVDHPSHNFVANGIVTHNSQLSQRYVDESDVAFVVPPAVLATDFPWQVWRRSVEVALEAYRELSGAMLANLTVAAWKAAGEIDEPNMDMDAQERDHALLWAARELDREARTMLRKRANEAARSVLPGCTETKIFVTANGRALRNLLEQRGSSQADAEIRRLALTMLGVLREASPCVFGDYNINRVNGVDCLDTPYPKV